MAFIWLGKLWAGGVARWKLKAQQSYDKSSRHECQHQISWPTNQWNSGLMAHWPTLPSGEWGRETFTLSHSLLYHHITIYILTHLSMTDVFMKRSWAARYLQHWDKKLNCQHLPECKSMHCLCLWLHPLESALFLPDMWQKYRQAHSKGPGPRQSLWHSTKLLKAQMLWKWRGKFSSEEVSTMTHFTTEPVFNREC